MDWAVKHQIVGRWHLHTVVQGKCNSLEQENRALDKKVGRLEAGLEQVWLLLIACIWWLDNIVGACHDQVLMF